MNSSGTYTTTYSTSTSSGAAAGVGLGVILLYLVFIIIMIAALWKVFKKAGHPGWAAIIPIYNLYIMCKITGRPDWWFVLFFVPFVNIVVSIMLALNMAKVFGKSTLFGVFGLLFFAPIGYLMLGFGKATYQGSAVAGTGTPPVAPTPPATPPASPAAPLPPV